MQHGGLSKCIVGSPHNSAMHGRCVPGVKWLIDMARSYGLRTGVSRQINGIVSAY